MSPRRRIWQPLLALVPCLVVAGCATSSAPVANGGTADPEFQMLVAARSPVVVLPATVDFVAVADESPLAPDEFGGTRVAAHIDTELLRVLDASGLSCRTIQRLPAEADTVIADLLPAASILVDRYSDHEPYQPHLAVLRRLGNADHLCVPVVHVQVGAAEWYNPMSGAMTQSTSSTVLRIALVDMEDGSVSWSAEGLVRALPYNQRQESINPGFAEVVRMILEPTRP